MNTKCHLPHDKAYRAQLPVTRFTMQFDYLIIPLFAEHTTKIQIRILGIPLFFYRNFNQKDFIFAFFFSVNIFRGDIFFLEKFDYGYSIVKPESKAPSSSIFGIGWEESLAAERRN